MEVEFVVRADDVLAAHEYVWDQPTNQVGVAGSTWAVLVFVGALLPCAGFLYVQGQLPLAALLIPILFVGVVSLKLIFWRPVLRRQLRRDLDQRADIKSKFLGWRRFKLTPEALVTATEHSSTTHAWAGVEKIAIASERAFFFYAPTLADVVPRRAFPDEESFKQFMEAAQRYWEAARQAPHDKGPAPGAPDTNIMADRRADR
jgi:hypothetical protein